MDWWGTQRDTSVNYLHFPFTGVIHRLKLAYSSVNEMMKSVLIFRFTSFHLLSVIVGILKKDASTSVFF